MGVKIDFGRVFPGLIIFLIGVGLFVLFILLAFLSFFLFFIPPLHGVFYLTLSVLVASLALMGLGVAFMIGGVRGIWNWSPKDWNEARSGRDRWWDELNQSQRIGEVFGLLVSILFLLFFVENQTRATGFFTTKFGTVEELFFYGPWFLGFAASIANAAYGRKNAVRPLQAFRDGFTAISAFWLLSVFPFDFAHLPDLLPKAISWAFFWVGDDIGALVLLLIGVASVVGMCYNSIVYMVTGTHHGHDQRLGAVS